MVRFELLVCCVLAGCGRNTVQQTSASAAVSHASEEARVRAVVGDVLHETATRAVGVALIDPRGQRYYTFGPRSVREPQGPAFDADTTFEIGSVSKVFAGIMLADAEQRAELTLDDPIARELPRLAVART